VFAPKVAKPQTKAAEASTSKPAPQRSTLVGQRRGYDPVEQVLFPQRAIGNQATLWLQARRDSVPSGNGRNDAEEQEIIGENTVPDKAPRSLSWNFSKIPLFPPERAALALVHRTLSMSGSPLDQSTRTFFEARFGHNLSQVRLHTGPDAATSARAINAAAYAVGQDVVFGEGRYAPNTNEGKRLQQPKTHSREVNNISTPEHPSEREAARVSDMALHQDVRNRSHDIAYSIRHHTAPLIVQRDLLAYTTEHTETLPTAPDSAVVTYDVYKADAAAIQTALQSLIASNKVGTRTVGDHVMFFSQGATRAEVSAQPG